MNVPAPSISGVILAGGLGRRLGGQDKGLIEVRGSTLVESLVEALAPQVDELVINANRNIARYAQFGCPVYPDCLPGYLGPLAGMLTGLEQARHDQVVYVPCDTPALPPHYVTRMSSALQHGPYRAVFAHDGQRAHPVYALLRRDCRDDLRRFLAAGGRRLGDWLRQLDAQAVVFPGLDGIANINAPGDLALLAALHTRAGPCSWPIR
jgi:molybdopterin-guanine dinucleotide biosynthesis protein A